LQNISGWKVVKVDGPKVQMVYRDEVNVSFLATDLTRVRDAVIATPGKTDALQQFMYTALANSASKGDIRMVKSQIIVTDYSS
jgi:hypothetical protein